VIGVECENYERTRFRVHHMENGEKKNVIYEIKDENTVDQIIAKIKFIMVNL